MKVGELMSFHTNLIHVGGPACDTGNQRKDPLRVNNKNMEALGEFKYFTKK